MSSEQNQSPSLHWLPAHASVYIPSLSLDGEAGRKMGGRGESSAHVHRCVGCLVRTWLVKGTLGGQWALFFVLFYEWSVFYLFFTFFSFKKLKYNLQCCHYFISSVQFRSVHSVVSNSLRPHGLQHARLPEPSPIPGACSNSSPSWWCHPTISSSVISFSPCLQLYSLHAFYF